MEILANDQHGRRRQQDDVLAWDVLAQVHQSRRHGDRGQESESAMIGLVLVEAQQVHTAIVQEALDVIGLEGGDEERGIQLSLLQGLGRGGDVLLDQHGPRVFLGGSGFDQAVDGEQLHGDGVGTAARRTDTDAFARELTEALEPLVAAVEDPQGLAVQAAQGIKVLYILGAGHAALNDGDRHARVFLPQQAQVLHRARRLAHLDGQALLSQFLGVFLGIADNRPRSGRHSR